jgi:flagellar protein FlaJ
MFKTSKDEIISGVLFSIAFLIIGIEIFKSEKIIMLSIIALFIPLALKHLKFQLAEEERQRQIEDEIPDMLLLASSIPDNARIDKLVDFISNNSNGPLKKEFNLAKNRIELGMPPEEALEKISERNSSKGLSRSIGMIINSIKSGADMSKAFRETAEDFIETNSITRERMAAMSLQKYTIIASCIIVPFVFAMVTSMVFKMDFSGINELGIGANEVTRKELLNAAEIGSIIYIAEFAIISSIFLGFQESRPKKSFLYAIILLIAGFIVYFFIKGF